MSKPVNAVVVLGRMIVRNLERGAARGSPSDLAMREVSAAVAELIAADHEYDIAKDRYAAFLNDNTFGTASMERLLHDLADAKSRRSKALDRIEGVQ